MRLKGPFFRTEQIIYNTNAADQLTLYRVRLNWLDTKALIENHSSMSQHVQLHQEQDGQRE